MEGISKYLRLRTATVLAAFVAAGLILMAMSGSANAFTNPVLTKDVSVGIVNDSKTPIDVGICPSGHQSQSYLGGEYSQSPCSSFSHTFHLLANGHRASFCCANPLGMVVRNAGQTAQDKTLYFFAENPFVGEPYFRAQGSKISLSEPPLGKINEALRHVDGVYVGLGRYEDDVRNGAIVKIMRIRIINWPDAPQPSTPPMSTPPVGVGF